VTSELGTLVEVMRAEDAPRVTEAPIPPVAATRRLSTALWRASMLDWYSVGAALSHDGGLVAVKALSIMDSGFPVVDSTDV
jgi:hypothetical protein